MKIPLQSTEVTSTPNGYHLDPLKVFDSLASGVSYTLGNDGITARSGNASALVAAGRIDIACESDPCAGVESSSKISGLDGMLEVTIDKRIKLYSIGPDYTLKDHDPLFDLARYVRTVEGCYSIRFGPNLLWEVFDRWVDRNRDHLEPDHDYHTDFLDKLT